MPSIIVPIEHTRAYSVRPPEGMRYGNFEGVIHLPPISVSQKVGEHSFSSLNNQQIYKTVCEWFETWRSWQQRVVLCGIIDRFSGYQLDMLATTLEPIRHRDYTTVLRHSYPSSPLKLPPPPERKPRERKPKKAKPKKGMLKKPTALKTLKTEPAAIPNKPVQKLIDESPRQFVSLPTEYSDLSTDTEDVPSEAYYIGETTENIPEEERPFHLFADNLAKSIVDEAIADIDLTKKLERTLSNFNQEPAVDVDELIHVAHVGDVSIVSEETRKETDKDTIVTKHVTMVTDKSEEETKPSVKASPNKKIAPGTKQAPNPSVSKKKTVKKKQTVIVDPLSDILKPLPGGTVGPTNVVRILSPDDQDKRCTSQPHSGLSDISQSMFPLSKLSTSKVRHSLFCTNRVNTPDFFVQDDRNRGPMQREVRFGEVRRPDRLQDLPVPLQHSYKSVKWWSDLPQAGTEFCKAKKQELTENFQDEVLQVYQWMKLWEDYEKITLLKELLKSSTAEILGFMFNHIHRRLLDIRHINRLSDKLLLFILSYLSPPEINSAAQVCRRWRFLCATDEVWMIKCHEIGIAYGIENIEEMVMKANQQLKTKIDWKLAYEELKRITRDMKEKYASMPAEEPVPDKGKKGRKLRHRKAELAVKRGTMSMIRRDGNSDPHRNMANITEDDDLEDEDDGSIVSEDLQDFTDDLDLDQPEAAPTDPDANSEELGDQEPPAEQNGDQLESAPDPLGVHYPLLDPYAYYPQEEKENLDGRQADLRRVDTGVMSLKTSVRRKKKETAVGEDMAYDIRPDLVQSTDLLGKSQPSMTLVWKKEKKSDLQDMDQRNAQYMGMVKSVKRVRKLQGHTNCIVCLQFDKKRLITAGLDRIVRVWDIRSGRSVHKMFGHKGGIHCLHFDDTILLTGSWDTTIVVWDMRRFESLATLTDHKGCVSCLHFNDEYIVSGSHDTTVRVWNRATFDCCKVIQGHTGAVNCLAFDGVNVVSGSSDRTLRLSNIHTGECLHVFNDGQNQVISVVMQGSLILSADKTGRVFFWNKGTGESEAAIQAHDGPIHMLALNGGRFLTASTDTTLKEWDLLTLTNVRVLQGHKGPVRDVKVANNRIVSCSNDGSVRIWDLFDLHEAPKLAEQGKQDMQHTSKQS